MKKNLKQNCRDTVPLTKLTDVCYQIPRRYFYVFLLFYVIFID
jgi:hypothetical protein